MVFRKSNYVDFLSIFFLILLNIIFYYPSLKYDFVWDDKELYINTKNIPEGNPFGKVPDHFVPKKDKMYIPMTNLFWSLVASLGGQQDGQFVPFSFHLFNLIVHILNSLLVFLLLKKLLGTDFGALFGAIIFSLHPIQIESVVWISEARGILSAFFGFSAILFYLSYKRDEVIKAIATSVLIVLSILSKPSGIVFPFLLLLTAWFTHKDLKLLEIAKKKWYIVLLIIPFVFISFQGETTKVIQFEMPFYFRPLAWLNSIGFYIQKIILPLNLSPGYGITYTYLNKSILNLYPLLITMSVLVLGMLLKTRRYFWFSVLFFIVGYLPVSNLFTFYYQYWSTVADRYIYVSMFGVAFFFGFFLEKNLSKYKYFSFVIIIIILLVISRNEISKWENEFKLWNDCIEKYPERIPQIYLGRGMAFEARGEISAALADYTKSIELDSNFYFGFYNRGNIFFDMKRYEPAILDFTRTIQINPRFVNAYVNRGLCYLEKNDLDMAISDFEKALKLDSSQIDVVLYLAEIWEEKNNIPKALEYYRRAISMGYMDNNVLKRIQLLENSAKIK